MSCPICGANCKCRKRGPGGICCDCHRHKASRKMKRSFRKRLEGLSAEAAKERIFELHREEREQITRDENAKPKNSLEDQDELQKKLF